MTMTRVASGVTTTAPLLFSDYPTVGAIATAVIALGNGWNATTTNPKWACSDFLPNTGAQSVLGGSADFQAFINDVTAYDFVADTGQIRFRNQSFDPVFSLMNVGGGGPLSVFPQGRRNVRVEYEAGYINIPSDVQQACLMTVKDLLYKLQTVMIYASESDVDWVATLSPFLNQGLSDAVKQLLQMCRSFRQF